MKQELHTKYWLSTEGYYFIYRHDKYNENILRATLFTDKDRQLDSIRVRSTYEDSGIEWDLSHTEVINYYEVMVNTDL